MNNKSYTIHSRRPARLTAKPVSGTFTKRYGNLLDPSNYNLGKSYSEYASGSGVSSGSTSSDWLGFANTSVGGFFSFLTGKQDVTRNSNDNFTRQQLSDEETKRTRAIVLGLVAIVLVVGAVMVMTKKK